MNPIELEAGAPGPAVLRLLVGAQLRRLRENAGVSRAEAGYLIRGSESKISRMELGRVRLKERDVLDLLAFYGVAEGPERDAILALLHRANQPGWWHPYLDVLPNWFQSYLGLEAASHLVRTYEVQFVPGLLQTRDYARAVVRLGHGAACDAEIERRVDVRVERQQVLSRADPPTVWAVVDEAALRRPVGGTAVMRSQLAALIDACNRPNIIIQVMPLAAGGHAAAGGSFTVLRFSEVDLPDLVYIEQLTSALYLEGRENIDHYRQVMDRLCAEAAPPDRTIAILTVILRDFERGEQARRQLDL